MREAKADGKPFSIVVVKAISNRKILPEGKIPDAEPSRRIHVTVAPGGYQPASFVVQANQRLVNLKPTCSDLRSADNILGASHIDIKVVKCWYQGCVSGDIQYAYCPGGPKRVLMPELLLHDSSLVTVNAQTKTNYLRIREGDREKYIDISRQSGDPRHYRPNEGPDTDVTLPGNVTFDDSVALRPVTLPPGENLQFWVTVSVPPDTPPGLYEGSLTIAAANAGPETVPLLVNVLPFTLDAPMVEYGLYYRGRLTGKNPERVGSEEKNEIQLRAEMADMARHGVVSCTVTQNYVPSEPARFGKFLEIMRSAGLGDTLYMLWVGDYYNDKDKTSRLLVFARKAGFRDVYFYGGDELEPAQAQARRESWRTMQGRGGKIFSALEKAAYSVPDILDLAVVSRIRDPQLAKAYHDHGHRVFSYGIPQVGVEEPETYRRSYGLTLWKAGYDGAMLYAYQHAWGCIWNDFDGYFRDHVFAYPTTNGVVDTIEWEGFREAVTDVRYVTTLVNLVRKAKGAGVPTTDVEMWLSGIDPDGDLDLIRSGVIERIIRLKSKIAHTS